jgi:integrase
MPRSRGNGEGSILKRVYPNGKVRFMIQVMTGYGEDGKRKRVVQSFEKREDAKTALTKILGDLQKGLPVQSSKQTVAEFLRAWLNDIAIPNTSPNTSRTYRSLIERHAIPAFGDVRLDKLTPRAIQALYREKLKTLSAQRVHHLHMCLHRAFVFAVRWELLPRNPLDMVDPPSVPLRETTALRPEQARAFLQAIQDDPMQAYWVLALTTAMRPGELRALHWRDLDLDAGNLHAQRAVIRDQGSFVEKDLKSHQGRNITLTPVAIEALRRQRARVREMKLRAGQKWGDLDLVFPTEVGTHQAAENILRRSFVPALERAGLPRIRPYDLRHSTATLLLQFGVSPKVISELLGHSSVSLTLNRYAHTVPTLQDDAMKRLGDLLGGAG